MASHVNQTQLVIQNENLNANWKKAGFEGSVKNSKIATTKGGVALGSRKALNDITNKTSVCQEASSRKKNVQKEEINVVEEKILHDHNRCIEEKQATSITYFLDLVFPGHDSSPTAEHPDVKQVKTDPDSPSCYPEPKELPMSVFSDWFEPSTQWNSPPCSPINWDSPPSSPFSWQFEEVEYVLPESDVENWLVPYCKREW